MIRIVFITPDMIERANRLSEVMPRFNNSILQGGGNLSSFVGQIAFEKLTGASSSNTYNYDCLLHGKKIELKIKQRNVSPKGYYTHEVAGYNTHQECDYYVFVSVLYNHTLAWVVGCMKPEEFYRRATFRKSGEVVNGFTYPCDAWAITINELYDIQEIGKEKNE